MTVPRILHLLPRFTGAGPERSLLASIAFAPATAPPLHHTVAVLDVPVAASMYLAARRLGVDLLVQPTVGAIEQAAAAADLIVVHYWNHPLLLSVLGQADLGSTRILVWSMVLGLHRPQVLTAEIGDFADVLVVTTERSMQSEAATTCAIVHTVPGIADMGRLDNWRPVPHDGIHVGYLGSVSPVKMHPRFAEMCARVRDQSVSFVIVGSGGGEDQLRARAVDLGLGARFACNGYTDDISTALGTFDIFGYPLSVDTYATSEKALQEAMWVGIPPVVFPHGGLVDLVEDEVTGLVVDDEDGYVAAIDSLVGDASLRRRLGDEARRVARERFDPHSIASAWANVIAVALAQPPRSRLPLYANKTGAELFVAANGIEAGPFARSLEPGGQSSSADGEIACSSPLVIGGDGGIAHYRKVWPEDPLLDRWAELVWNGKSSRAHPEM
jgi:glycosyltransferase involved in cell wall biosynthesis